MRAVVKHARDLVADSAAGVVLRVPSLEPVYIGIGRLLWKVPLLKTVYRRSTDTLAKRLRAAGRQFRDVRHGPHVVRFDVTDFTAKGLYFLSIPYEPATIRWMLDHLRGGDIVVDVGANHGYHSMIAAALVGATGRVFAFEPNPEVLTQLREHARQNGFQERITVSAAALSDTTGDQVALYVSSCASNSGLSSLDPTWEVGASQAADRTVLVETERFDEWRERAQVDRIDLVKIDVEGAEDRVVRGMACTLETAPPRHIICETTEGSDTDRALTQRGYDRAILEWVGNLANVLYTHRAND